MYKLKISVRQIDKEVLIEKILTEVLISSILPRLDNLNGKCRLVNMFLKKFCMENDFFYVNHDNIKPRQHCNYRGIHLNTPGILANNLILNMLT